MNLLLLKSSMAPKRSRRNLSRFRYFHRRNSNVLYPSTRLPKAMDLERVMVSEKGLVKVSEMEMVKDLVMV